MPEEMFAAVGEPGGSGTGEVGGVGCVTLRRGKCRG